jgi:hypothetical protein
MTSSHSNDQDDPLLAEPVMSREALTPRGGFMARPGLKAPPRHAVVVRVGDAPDSPHIPRARSSVPPPPPSAPAPTSASEKVTLRAIPTPSSPPPAVAPVLESLPPPSQAPLSDAPLVSHLAASRAPSARGAGGSRWTIVLAAAAGLVLGLASVAVRMRSQSAASQPPRGVALSASVSAPPPKAPQPKLAPPPGAEASARAASGDAQAGELKATHASPPTAKRSIF